MGISKYENIQTVRIFQHENIQTVGMLQYKNIQSVGTFQYRGWNNHFQPLQHHGHAPHGLFTERPAVGGQLERRDQFVFHRLTELPLFFEPGVVHRLRLNMMGRM